VQEFQRAEVERVCLVAQAEVPLEVVLQLLLHRLRAPAALAVLVSDDVRCLGDLHHGRVRPEAAAAARCIALAHTVRAKDVEDVLGKCTNSVAVVARRAFCEHDAAIFEGVDAIEVHGGQLPRTKAAGCNAGALLERRTSALDFGLGIEVQAEQGHVELFGGHEQWLERREPGCDPLVQLTHSLYNQVIVGTHRQEVGEARWRRWRCAVPCRAAAHRLKVARGPVPPARTGASPRSHSCTMPRTPNRLCFF
jgi:hypothetical protein